MEEKNQFIKLETTIQTAVNQAKCRKCGCMKGSLVAVKQELAKSDESDGRIKKLTEQVQAAIDLMEPAAYTWLGCKQCWSAEVTNEFDAAFSEFNAIHTFETVITADEANSLPAVGEFFVLALDEDHPVAVSTLGSPELAEELFKLKPEGLCITGKTETENIGIEKIIQNVLATPSIQYLILCGRESEGHYSGNTILSLFENGVDNKQKVLGSKGKKPTLANISETQIAAFRTQVEIVDLIGCSDLDGILEKIKELKDKEFRKDKIRSASAAGTSRTRPVRTEIVLALEKDPEAVKLDPAGYFVIVPKPEQKQILVEHYSNKNQLLRIIKGENARNIYWMILENQWATEMSHAAYLGKELTRAEIAMEEGSKYIQDKA